jgi:hypothetical protein
MRYADRICAIRRCGELAKKIEPKRGANQNIKAGAHPKERIAVMLDGRAPTRLSASLPPKNPAWHRRPQRDCKAGALPAIAQRCLLADDLRQTLSVSAERNRERELHGITDLD